MVNNLIVQAKKPTPLPVGYRIKLVTMSAISAVTELKEAEKWSFKSKIWKPKINSFVIKKP